MAAADDIHHGMDEAMDVHVAFGNEGTVDILTPLLYILITSSYHIDLEHQ